MEARSKKRGRLLLVSLLVSLAVLGGLAFWIYTGPYRFYRQPLPAGSQVPILVRALYLNDTGTIAGTSYVEGVNVTFSDASNGAVSSIVTPSNIVEVNLIVGHGYQITARVDTSSKSIEASFGGYGGYLEVLIWDNRTMMSLNYANFTH